MATIFGQFELLENIGSGSMAQLFRARSIHHPELGVCVIKRIRSEFKYDTNLMARFVEGTQLVVNHDHPNIPKVIEAGVLVGRYYVALEYVHGKDLRNIQQQFQATRRALPMPLAMHVMTEVCKALHFVHSSKDTDDLPLVHCDVSTSNIMISFSGMVKLINFEGSWFRMKGWAPTKGKCAYMSPEQASRGPIDARADVFSAGIVFWEITTGQHLFEGKTDDEIREKVEAAEVPRPTTVNKLIPKEMEEVIVKALARDPADRYQSAAEMYYALDDFAKKARLSFSAKQLAGWMKMTFPAEGKEAEAREPVIAPPPPRPAPPLPPPPVLAGDDEAWDEEDATCIDPTSQLMADAHRADTFSLDDAKLTELPKVDAMLGVDEPEKSTEDEEREEAEIAKAIEEAKAAQMAEAGEDPQGGDGERTKTDHERDVDEANASYLDEAMKTRRSLTKRIDGGDNLELRFAHLEGRRASAPEPDERKSMVQILILVGILIVMGLAMLAYLMVSSKDDLDDGDVRMTPPQQQVLPIASIPQPPGSRPFDRRHRG